MVTIWLLCKHFHWLYSTTGQVNSKSTWLAPKNNLLGGWEKWIFYILFNLPMIFRIMFE